MSQIALEDGTVVTPQHLCSIDETEQQDDRELVLVEGPKAEKVAGIFRDLYDSAAHVVIDSRETLTQGIWPIILKHVPAPLEVVPLET